MAARLPPATAAELRLARMRGARARRDETQRHRTAIRDSRLAVGILAPVALLQAALVSYQAYHLFAHALPFGCLPAFLLGLPIMLVFSACLIAAIDADLPLALLPLALLVTALGFALHADYFASDLRWAGSVGLLLGVASLGPIGLALADTVRSLWSLRHIRLALDSCAR